MAKAYVRAGNAHWKLGNLEAALSSYDEACKNCGPQPDALEQKSKLEDFKRRKTQVSPSKSLYERLNPGLACPDPAWHIPRSLNCKKQTISTKVRHSHLHALFEGVISSEGH